MSLTFGGDASGGIPSIPGDPGALSSAANSLGAAASAVRDGGYRLATISSGLSGSTWSGQGQLSFASLTSSLQAGHRSAASALSEASSALSSFASVLNDCQAQVRTAQAELAEAQAWAASALARLSSEPLAPHDPGAAAQRAYAVAAIEDHLRAAVQAAMSKGQAAWDRYEAAASSAAAQISAATSRWSEVHKSVGLLSDKDAFAFVPAGAPAASFPSSELFGNASSLPKDLGNDTEVIPVGDDLGNDIEVIPADGGPRTVINAGTGPEGKAGTETQWEEAEDKETERLWKEAEAKAAEDEEDGEATGAEKGEQTSGGATAAEPDLSTAPDQTVFWSGLGPDGEAISDDYAGEVGRTTLVQLLRERGIPVPSNDDRKGWDKLSELLAKGASGTVVVLLGNPGPESTWLRVEQDELMDNQRVTKIIKVDPKTGATSVLMSR